MRVKLCGMSLGSMKEPATGKVRSKPPMMPVVELESELAIRCWVS